LIKNTYNIFKDFVAKNSWGKRIGSTLYIYAENVEYIDNNIFPGIKDLLKCLVFNFKFNVVKLNLKLCKISFLHYPHFFEIPHPELTTSTTINLSNKKIKKYDYSRSNNPPILHRKETLLEPDHPLIPKFCALTKAEEMLGLYSNKTMIGYKRNWDQLLAEKNLFYEGHKLIKLDKRRRNRNQNRIKIQRHKTAITRYNFSRPIQTLLEYKLLGDESTIFDYGCGQGDDIRGLNKMGVSATGWDPLHRPNQFKKSADIVNLGFVLNVIEDQNERAESLLDAFSLAKKLLIVSCLMASSNTKDSGTPYKDGVLTNRKTFQKYFRQDELRKYIENVLIKQAVTIGPGIFYVFRSPWDQQDFISKRSKREINWEEISRNLYPNRAAQLRLKREELYENNRELFNAFWNTMLDLGRIPTKDEFGQLHELQKKVGHLKAAKSMFIEKYGEETLKQAFEIRRNDLLVYMALSNFRQRVPLKYLPKDLQTDVKTFLGGYKSGFDESKKLLFSIGNPELIEKQCDNIEFGKLDDQALYIHKSLIPELHPILRIYVGCAGILYGDYENSDIIKIHKRSGKVTFLTYRKFETDPLPELKERVKVNLKNQQVDIFDHRNPEKQQVLYFKDHYVSDEYSLKNQWEKYSKKLKKLGFDENMRFGLTKDEFLEFIGHKGLTINLNKKRKKS